ncbi:MAG: 3-oxoacyl-ACP synthase [Deltaproteobacteria bacterium]|nr:3-oxoacyl-ACP synthase [Deltaproteobacteria bacterium]
MSFKGVSFSVASYAAWAPRVETKDAWLAWAIEDYVITGGVEPPVQPMSAMLRRRAGVLGKMALEVAYQCLGGSIDVPTVFSSRHGEASRSVDLLLDLAKGVPLSPTSFGMSVHNATGGLFSIARSDHAGNFAVAAGDTSVEHAVIEACGLLNEGEPAVLLVVYDCPLPALYFDFEDCHEQPYAWAWLMQPPADEIVSLTWSGALEGSPPSVNRWPAGLEVLRFYLRKDPALERICDKRRWLWSRHD